MSITRSAPSLRAHATAAPTRLRPIPRPRAAASTTCLLYTSWFVIPIAGLFYNGIVRRANREKAVTTYIDRVVGYVWWVFGSAAVLCSLLSFFVRLDILFIILLLMGLATALTGLVTRFRLCVVSGMVSALLLAPVCLSIGGIDQCLIFAAVFAVMMVIPGHILDFKCRRLCSEN